MIKKYLPAFLLVGLLGASTVTGAQSPAPTTHVEPLDAATLNELKALYKQLIDAENVHDLDAVRRMIWNSPSAMFVAKKNSTSPHEDRDWSAFWGPDAIAEHLGALWKPGGFRIDPDYSKEKVVGLSPGVAQTYVPVKISVGYAGQRNAPKPFIMIILWVKTSDGWKMATDIPLPVPAVQWYFPPKE